MYKRAKLDLRSTKLVCTCRKEFETRFIERERERERERASVCVCVLFLTLPELGESEEKSFNAFFDWHVYFIL